MVDIFSGKTEVSKTKTYPGNDPSLEPSKPAGSLPTTSPGRLQKNEKGMGEF